MNILFFLIPKSEVAYIFEDETLRQTLEKMEHRKYSCIPILTMDGKYLGTISEGDLLWGMRRADIHDIKETEGIPIMAIPRRATYKPVHAEGKYNGDGKSQPSFTKHLCAKATHMKGNIIHAHPEHHAKAHDKGEQQALSFVDRHKGHGPFRVTPRHHATKTGGQDGAVGTSSRPPVIRASATTYVVEPA